MGDAYTASSLRTGSQPPQHDLRVAHLDREARLWPHHPPRARLRPRRTPEFPGTRPTSRSLATSAPSTSPLDTADGGTVAPGPIALAPAPAGVVGLRDVASAEAPGEDSAVALEGVGVGPAAGAA